MKKIGVALLAIIGLGVVPRAPAAPALLLAGSDGHIFRYDVSNGTFQGEFVPGGILKYASGLTFGPDGSLYVSDFVLETVLRFDGRTGAYLGTFVSAPGRNPSGLVFGPDGNLYVGMADGAILRFDGRTGTFLDTFIQPPSLHYFAGMQFHQDSLFVTYVANPNGSLYRYNAQNGAFLGVLFDAFSGNGPRAPRFGPDGNLYVPDWQTPDVFRFNSTNYAFAGLAVHQTFPWLSPLAVDFSPNGNLLVLRDDFNPNSVQEYNLVTGAFVRILVPPGLGGLGRAAAMLVADIEEPDSDGDGVPDSADLCPGTPPGAVVNEHGCSIEQLCPCDGAWKNHGEYVTAVAATAQEFLKAGLITSSDVHALRVTAAKSDCGKKTKNNR